MTKKRGPNKPKVVWVGSTPITPITAKECCGPRLHLRVHCSVNCWFFVEIVVDVIS